MSRFVRHMARILLLWCTGLLALSTALPIGQTELHAQQDFNFNDRPAREASPAELAVMLVVYGVIIAVALAVHIVICYLLYTVLQAVPPQFRLMEPGMVWLMLIPCFNLVWIFFVYVRIARSYQNYFRSVGRYDVGDCGESIGLWYCICVCLSIVPCVGGIAGLISFILMIVYLVKLFGLKGQMQAGLAQPKWGAT